MQLAAPLTPNLLQTHYSAGINLIRERGMRLSYTAAQSCARTYDLVGGTRHTSASSCRRIRCRRVDASRSCGLQWQKRSVGANVEHRMLYVTTRTADMRKRTESIRIAVCSSPALLLIHELSALALLPCAALCCSTSNLLTCAAYASTKLATSRGSSLAWFKASSCIGKLTTSHQIQIQSISSGFRLVRFSPKSQPKLFHLQL